MELTAYKKWIDNYVGLLPRRYCVAIFLFLGSFLIYTMRANLSVSIEPISCQYRWSNKLQGYALSSFFIGYFVGNVPSGYLSQKYGAKLIYGTGIFITSILTLILPHMISSSVSDANLNCKCDDKIAKEWVFINGNYQQIGAINDIIFDNDDDICESESYFYLLCIIRIITGLFESVAFPSSYYLINNWSINTERSRFVSLNSSGSSVGTAFTLFICPILIESQIFGWKYTFYIFAILALIYIIFWYYFLYDSPNKDPWIKTDELLLINKSNSKSLLNDNDNTTSGNHGYPWKAFLTHPVAWSLYAAHFSFNWTHYFILTMLPTYINKELKYDLSTSAFIQFMPLILKTIMSTVSSVIVDKMIMKGLYNKWNIRRISQIIATILAGWMLVLCSYVDNGLIAIFFMLLSICLSGMETCGFQSVYVEVSPNLSSVIYGISNSFATLPGIIAPIFSGYILGESPGNYQWKILFYVAFCINTVGCIVFCYLGTTQKITALNNKT